MSAVLSKAHTEGELSQKWQKSSKGNNFLLCYRAMKWLVVFPRMKRYSMMLAGKQGSLRLNICFPKPSDGSAHLHVSTNAPTALVTAALKASGQGQAATFTFPATELLFQLPACLDRQKPLCNFTSGKHGAVRNVLRRESPSVQLLPPLVQHFGEHTLTRLAICSRPRGDLILDISKKKKLPH